MKEHTLDLRGITCPMNFVKTKLFLDKLSPGEVVGVLLDAGEPLESVSGSIEAEGHTIVDLVPQAGGHFCLRIAKEHRPSG